MKDGTPLRILFDLSRLRPGGEGGGIKLALVGLLRWLTAEERGAGFEFVFLSNAELSQDVLELPRSCDRMIDARTAPPDIAARLNCDVVYCSFGTVDFACPGVPTILLIVDLLHQDFPESLSEPDRIFREQHMQSALSVADCFHVISEFTSARLQSCYNIPTERIVRTYLPLPRQLGLPSELATSRPEKRDPCFLYPANTWIHKNHETLLVAYARYCRDCGPDCWPLVLTGHVHDARGKQLRALARLLNIEEKLVWAGYVNEAKLVDYYARAGALVFPSLYEGFGLPLLEAMAMGVPIVAHNGTGIPEVVGQAALLVDATNPVQLADAMALITRDVRLRTMLAERGRRRVLDFSPDVEFEKLYRFFVSARQLEARWKRKGFYDVDGLTDPVAIFALPTLADLANLSVSLRPLPADRTLQLWCGLDLVGEMKCAAFSHATGQFAFKPKCRALTLRVPDASRLCDTDPRTHGVLLESLKLKPAEGESYDLLSDK